MALLINVFSISVILALGIFGSFATQLLQYDDDSISSGQYDTLYPEESVLFSYKTKNKLASWNYGVSLLLYPPVQGLMFRVIKSNFQEHTCSDDYLIIRDGLAVSGRLVTRLCGTSFTSDVYHQDSGMLWMEYNKTSNISYPSSFQLLITLYTEDKTGVGCSGAFKCNNGFCIGQRLVCDGWDNCGDNSDETMTCTENYPVVQMNRICQWSTVPVITPAILVRFDQINFAVDMYSGLTCTIFLEADHPDERLLVKALKVGFLFSNCNTAYLLVKDTLSERNITKFCQTNVPDRAYETTGNELSLQYSSSFVRDSFQLLITKFVSSCSDGSKFGCDGGQCIDLSLVCDGQNNCGDNSDEKPGCQAQIPVSPSLGPDTTTGSAWRTSYLASVVISLLACCLQFWL